jgi:hypothetical protein
MGHIAITWTSADGQSSIDVSGEYRERTSTGAIEEAREHLREQCADDAQRAGIDAGTIAIDRRAMIDGLDVRDDLTTPLQQALREAFGAADAGVDSDGEPWIAGPQVAHTLTDDELIQLYHALDIRP